MCFYVYGFDHHLALQWPNLRLHFQTRISWTAVELYRLPYVPRTTYKLQTLSLQPLQHPQTMQGLPVGRLCQSKLKSESTPLGQSKATSKLQILDRPLLKSFPRLARMITHTKFTPCTRNTKYRNLILHIWFSNSTLQLRSIPILTNLFQPKVILFGLIMT